MDVASSWIPVGQLGKAFEPEANLLPPTHDLVGRHFRLHLENGRSEECRFLSESLLDWRPSEKWSGLSVREQYRATKVREGIYFVDFVRHLERSASTSLVLDLRQEVFTMVLGQLPTLAESRTPLLDRVSGGMELTAVTAEFRHGAIGSSVMPSTPRHAATEELVDCRIEYTYSPTEQYEHIYLNTRFYSWQCLRGSEHGLADTDRCHYYRIDEKLYLFVWREKIVPTLGVVVLDLDAMKTTGKILGYKGYDSGEVANFPVGAKARLLNVTRRG